MRLIDCDAFLQMLANIGYGTDYDGDLYFAYMSGADTIIGMLEDAPTLTPESLVKRGRWGDYERYENAPSLNGFPCSVCHTHQQNKTLYCPNCGAKMEDIVFSSPASPLS